MVRFIYKYTFLDYMAEHAESISKTLVEQIFDFFFFSKNSCRKYISKLSSQNTSSNIICPELYGFVISTWVIYYTGLIVLRKPFAQKSMNSCQLLLHLRHESEFDLLHLFRSSVFGLLRIPS